MEFIIGASSAVGAVIFTNPLEVVKTRFQLQGELKKKGQYTVHYKNFFHAFYLIGKTEGVLALQKGLASAAIHQAKIRLQSQANKSIAVGYQHEAKNTFGILNSVYREGGITGLWRGVIGSVPRICVGSASQLTAFYVSKEFLANNKYFVIHSGLLNTFVSSMIGGIFVAITMGPLDVISTRLYNQGITKDGKGILYNGYFDCVTKIWKTEGFKGFYKGIVPCYMRIGPHTVLCFVFWDELKKLQAYLEKK
ncbi:solute carrier family 25 member 35-like isoform X2 [Cimex lectularius]|uniref:Uncharacterized protein n=1 Tax=Cimex lectularius TaxID=79782 RepID=A0A8I6S1J2_CIMLE|nr:solute carrier family 25 member 35-like isoform X2 [Cimex lectularius]